MYFFFSFWSIGIYEYIRKTVITNNQFHYLNIYRLFWEEYGQKLDDMALKQAPNVTVPMNIHSIMICNLRL
jgi:hypothetical protein